MRNIIDVNEAKTHSLRLITRVMAVEEIIIAKAGSTVAKLAIQREINEACARNCKRASQHLR